ncbi:peptidoglycan editing factor PgeF [Tenuifilum thalassicum]|uniref:Purine nucleoside phosphorylase n=1 Tax=Tenuifilum thalassicum TaxID=2590900 RepID=A0A7D3XWB0_9BACT|nr:peptidoglycan editing factor PgeF [Tenuifilum thalassicum]QKG80371.1 peptidoglycan editing factor PgeF [Tenuifilum thalassicum]
MPLAFDDILFFKFEKFSNYDSTITHFISTRIGLNEDKQFSIGLNGFLPDAKVLENRQILAQKFGFDPSCYVFAEQVHGNKVELITDKERGRGAFSKADALQSSDAWITKIPNICLVAQAADCVPILFFDPINKAIGAAHAGWKGTVKRIAAEVVYAMKQEFGTNPADLMVGIGPSAGPCCYEVGDDVISIVNQVFPAKYELLIKYDDMERPVFDLWRANLYTLQEVGVKYENVDFAGLCTICNKHLFFSARSGDKGRFGAAIMINSKMLN